MSERVDKFIEWMERMVDVIKENPEDSKWIIFWFTFYARDINTRDEENPDWKIRSFTVSKEMTYFDEIMMKEGLKRDLSYIEE